MSNKKISFGKSYIPEAAGENIDNRLVYDFGKKYAVLDYKFKELKDGSVYTAQFDVNQETASTIIFTVTFYNQDGQALNSSSVEIPSTPIDSVYLNYEDKKLVIETTNGPDIEADLSELIDKVIALEDQVEVLNYEVAVGLDISEPELARTWFQPSSTIEDESLGEQVLGYSDVEIHDDADENDPEFIPGFSDNEVK
jgi:hypothetical protein